MGGNAGTFRPDAPLTQRALSDLVTELTDRPPPEPASPAAHATLAGLDQALVRGLDLADDARRFHLEARATGAKPPARFGSEVVARLIGLRKNHEARFDALELIPDDVATRRGRVLGRADPPLLRLGAPGRQGCFARVRATGLHAVAAPHPPDRLQSDRVPVRLGREELG